MTKKATQKKRTTVEQILELIDKSRQADFTDPDRLGLEHPALGYWRQVVGKLWSAYGCL